MKKDAIFLKGSDRIDDFEFNAEVAEVFEDMITRSVPFYLEQQDMFKGIAKNFLYREPMSTILDPLQLPHLLIFVQRLNNLTIL